MSSFHHLDSHYHCIVIGNPIVHSKSPALHHAFAKQTGVKLSYQRQYCPNEADSFTAVVEAFFAGGGIGANVTVPFKEIAFELCRQRGQLSDYARQAGAVNTLAIKDNKLYGDNTDGRGLVADLLSQGVTLEGANVAIIGAGGATRGTILPLLDAGIKSLHIANRTVAKAQALTQLFESDKLSFSSLTDLPKQVDIIINATSIGLSGEQLPFSDALTANFAYDMMYGKPSAFLDFFNAKHIKTSDGVGMLINQGALSFELWTGKKVDMAALDNPFR